MPLLDLPMDSDADDDDDDVTALVKKFSGSAF